jgi:hypothetical protein
MGLVDMIIFLNTYSDFMDIINNKIEFHIPNTISLLHFHIQILFISL